MNHGGCRISTVASRHALHFVYYNTTKKTVFGLTKCVRRGPVEPCGTGINVIARSAHTRFRKHATAMRTNTCCCKNIDEIRLSCTFFATDNRAIATNIDAHARHVFDCGAPVAHMLARQNFFSQGTPKLGGAGSESIKNERISAK